MIRKTYKDKNTTFTPLYKNLLAWQIADELAKSVYKTTKTFPKDETYGLTSQLRRATLSVALNIIEGYARNNKNEFRQFLRIALGSLAEATYLLEFALDQNYLSTNAFKEITEKRNRCGQLLWKLFQSQTK